MNNQEKMNNYNCKTHRSPAMSIVRFKPNRAELDPFFGGFTPMSRMIEDFFNATRSNEPLFWGPNVDVVENDNSYEIHAELPGVKQEDVKLTLNNNTLTLSGEKKQLIREEQGTQHRVERTYGRFERTFSLPRSVKVENVRAEFEDGVLRVTLPKAEEAKARAINIEVKK
jgi:HSP20 family protein